MKEITKDEFEKAIYKYLWDLCIKLNIRMDDRYI